MDALNRVVGCVTYEPLRASAGVKPRRWQIEFVDASAPLANQRRLSLQIRHGLDLVNEGGLWRVSTHAYAYQIHVDDRETIACHWHPGRSRFNGPHAHAKSLSLPLPLGKAHIPTGRTSLESVVRLLVDELGAAPVHPGWRQAVARTEAEHRQRRTWQGDDRG